MRRSLLLVSLILFGMFTACEPGDESMKDVNLQNDAIENLDQNKLHESSLPDYFVSQLESYENVLINTYLVEFTGRELKGSGESLTTTFNYRVSGTGFTPQLDSFFLEVPACAGSATSWTPQQPVNVQPTSIKWNNSVSKDGSQDYSVTYAGDVPLGIISSTVTRGSYVASGLVLGPCKGVYTLSGSIYIDANNNGTKQPEESGISSISVDLFDSDNVKLGSVNTSDDGSYSFMVLAGNYRIAVGDDLLNDANYTAGGDTEVTVENVSKDLSGFNFGYLVNSSKIIKDLEDKVLQVNTEPTKFWISAIKNAGKRNSPYTKEQILALLVNIEGLLLEEPFQFGTEKESIALEILSRPIKTPLDEFLQQLLTAELNIVSGRGALLPNGEQNEAFNKALLIYGEAVACRESGNCSGETGTSSINYETKALRSTDTKLLTSFNGSGGI